MNYDLKYASFRDVCEDKLEKLCAEESGQTGAAMRYALLGGGKRVRGVMTLALNEMLGGDADAALLAACALEMVHAYSLVHDDLPCMDNDLLRRGKPSTHAAFGESTALLAGDALLTKAFAVLAQIKDAEICQACVASLANAAGNCGMIRGQELDLAAENKTLSEEQLREVHRCKTGALFTCCVQMACACARSSARERQALEQYAANIGLAFQVVDDILDCTADESTLGKPIGSDAAQGKNTYTVLLGVSGARALASELSATAAEIIGEYGERSRFLAEMAGKLLDRIY